MYDHRSFRLREGEGVKQPSLRIAFLVLGSVMAADRFGYAQVVSPPTISKNFFGVATIPLNGTTALEFIITNPNSSVAFTGMAFTDTLPAGLVVATPNGLFDSCDGTATATAGSNTISLSAGTLPQSSTCIFVVNVTGTTAGVKNNTSGSVSSTEGGTGGTASASITVVTPVPVVPTLNESGMLIFGLLIAAAGLLLVRRR